MTSNFLISSTTTGLKDLDDEFVTNQWLVEQFVGETLFAFGGNTNGQFGNGTTATNYSSPIQLGSFGTWSYLNATSQNTNLVGLKNDGTLWVCGYNNSGQLGNGTTISYSSPIQIGSLTNWKQVTTGINSALAVKLDGTMWAWGQGSFYQIGNGASSSYSSPVQVGNLSIWKQVAAANYQQFAIGNDGTLWSWGGYNVFGVLGNNSGSTAAVPTKIGNLTNWKTVNTGGFQAGATKTDGTLWMWGNNQYGQLGNNASGVSYSSPIQVGTMTNWKQLACGGQYHTAAVKTDGTLWTWGFNSTGQLGIGNIISYSSPVQIGSLTTWKQVACGQNHSAAIKTDGTLWAWGYNPNGQIGNGTAVTYSSPIQVGTLTNWKQVTCGYNQTFAIIYADII
jgi:alpha-tubulin suppressor-like RCC1 family protein